VQRIEDALSPEDILERLRHPDRTWTREEVLRRPSPVPAEPGIHGWRFHRAPHEELEPGRLSYVGIAPLHSAVRQSMQTLRSRIRYHYRGNAAGSTLRLSLGCLIGLELRRVGSGDRMTFGPDGEEHLNQWMELNAVVSWVQCPAPWEAKSIVISRADLPLNLDQNRSHGFHARLSALRAEARARARELPVLR